MVMDATGLKVLFYLKKNETNTEGLCPVMGRITINKVREPFSTRLWVPVSLWDSKSGRLMGKSGHAVAMNAELSSITTAIHGCYMERLNAKSTVTAGQVKAAFQGMAFTQEALLKFYRQCNDSFIRRVGKDRAGSTAKVYDRMLSDLTRFVQEKYHLSDIPFSALTYSFIEEYDFWMRITRRLGPGTIVNRTGRLIYIIKQASSRGHIATNPFADYKAVRNTREQKFLPEDDLQKILQTPLPKNRLYLTRDMFLFACFTGLVSRQQKVHKNRIKQV